VRWVQKKENHREAAELPAQLLATLNSLDRESIVLNSSGNVIFATSGCAKLNIIKDEKLNSEEMLALVRAVRRTSKNQEGSVEVARGPIGEGKRELQLTVSTISEDGQVLIVIDDEGEKQRIDAIRRDFI
jgi:two-component system sensor histidine kinase SenX3